MTTQIPKAWPPTGQLPRGSEIFHPPKREPAFAWRGLSRLLSWARRRQLVFCSLSGLFGADAAISDISTSTPPTRFQPARSGSSSWTASAEPGACRCWRSPISATCLAIWNSQRPARRHPTDHLPRRPSPQNTPQRPLADFDDDGVTVGDPLVPRLRSPWVAWLS
jgi:hypothetical protein